MSSPGTLLNIAQHRLSSGDRLFMPYSADEAENRGRFVEYVVVGVVPTDPTKPLATKYELQLAGFKGPWTPDLQRAIEEQSSKEFVLLEVSLEDEIPPIYEVQREQDKLYPEGTLPQIVSTERIVKQVHAFLLGFQPPYRCRYELVVQRLQALNLLPEDDESARISLSRALGSDIGRMMVKSKGGWCRAITTGDARATAMTDYYRTNPGLNPGAQGQIVINWPLFTEGLKILLASLSNVVIVDESTPHERRP